MDGLEIKLLIDGTNTKQSVHPVFGEDIKISIEREDEQIFRREKIDGTFQFVGEDFDLINSCSINTLFTLQIYRNDVFVSSGTFRKTDCEINYDDKNISVRLSTTDIYEKILADYDNEYNLVKLAPVIKSLTLKTRGVLQLYAKGESVLTNIVGGMYFEQTASEITDSSVLINTYHFSAIAPMAYISIAASQILDSTYSDAAGKYFMYYSITANDILYKQEDGHYHIQVSTLVNTALLIDDDTSTTIAAASLDLTDGAVWDFISGSTTILHSTYNKDGELYGRYLCPTNTYDSYIVDRPTEDICEYDSNYPYVRPSGSGDIVPRLQMITKRSSTPTSWGIDSNMEYFTEPVLTDEQKTNGNKSIPVGQSHWARMSTWLVLDTELRNVTDYFNKDFTLKDAYPIWSAIKVLLAQVDSSISFGSTEDYSIFLYNASTNANSAIGTYQFPRSRNQCLYITPITNVKKTNYEQAAQKGDISLKQILDMLRKVFRCYWWIDSSNRLRIEHISYFKHGYSYADDPISPAIDVTKMLTPMSRKSWCFAKNSVTYEAESNPSRFEFKWGDSVTEPFTGIAIDVKDPYLDANKKESVSVENFVTDVDYTIVNSSEISDDIYVLLEADYSTNQVPLGEIRLNEESPIYKMQNGYLSFLFAEQHYYAYDMSGWQAEADGSRIEVIGTRSIKKQKITFPCTIAQSRSIGYIRTEIGDGEIEKMELNADTLVAEAEVSFAQDKDLGEYITVTYEPHFPNRRAYLVNDSDSSIRVTYADVLNGGITRIRTSTVYAHQQLLVLDVIATNQTIIQVLNTEDVSAYTIDRVAKMTDGRIEVSHYWQSTTETSFVFQGDNEEAKDWAMLHITAKKNLSITIMASSEATWDVGWADTEPRGNTATAATYKASGVSSTTFTLDSGQGIYLGYTKDSSVVGNEDKILFEITEL